MSLSLSLSLTHSLVSLSLSLSLSISLFLSLSLSSYQAFQFPPIDLSALISQKGHGMAQWPTSTHTHSRTHSHISTHSTQTHSIEHTHRLQFYWTTHRIYYCTTAKPSLNTQTDQTVNSPLKQDRTVLTLIHSLSLPHPFFHPSYFTLPLFSPFPSQCYRGPRFNPWLGN